MIRWGVKAVVATSAGFMAARAVGGRHGALVLMYHRVGPRDGLLPSVDVAQFRLQMAWLRRNCAPIAPEELQARARAHDPLRPPVLVTFDDGYRDYHDHAYPVLKELGIPAVVFLSTVFMDEGGLLWADRLHLATRHARRSAIRLPWGEGRSMGLADAAGKAAFLRACKDHLKGVTDEEAGALLAELLRELADGAAPPPVERQMLSWDEVRATLDLTRFGGHSHTHPILSRVGGDRLEREIRTCRDRIEAETGIAPRLFAYTNGRAEDFNQETKAALRRHGFEMAFTTIEGVNGAETDWMEIRRYSSGRDVPEMAWSLSGLAGRL